MAQGGQFQKTKLNQLATLFLNTSKAGTKYYSGKITVNGTEVKVVGFRAEINKDDKQYIVLNLFEDEKKDDVKVSPKVAKKSLDDIPF